MEKEYNISWYSEEEDNGRRRTSDWRKVKTNLHQKINIFIRRSARKRSSEEDKKVKWWVAPPVGKRTCKLRLHMLTHIFTAYQLWQITWHTLTNHSTVHSSTIHITEHRSCDRRNIHSTQTDHIIHIDQSQHSTLLIYSTVDVPYTNHHSMWISTDTIQTYNI